jgi:hypothetical protein
MDERRERDHAAGGAESSIGPSRFEEGIVPTVMLENEDPDDEPGAYDAQRQGCEIGDVDERIHRCADDEKGHKRIDDLPDTFAQDGFTKSRDGGSHILFVGNLRPRVLKITLASERWLQSQTESQMPAIDFFGEAYFFKGFSNQ